MIFINLAVLNFLPDALDFAGEMVLGSYNPLWVKEHE